jgi:phosphoenolpyruvate-protein kinase (PTS system EI component)
MSIMFPMITSLRELQDAKAVLEEQSFENKMLKSYIKNWPSETPVA